MRVSGEGTCAARSMRDGAPTAHGRIQAHLGERYGAHRSILSLPAPMLGFLACRISFAWGGRGGATVSSSSGNCGMADRMRTSAREGAKSVRTEGAARAWKMIGRRSAFWLALDCGRALFDEFFHNLTFFPKWFVKCERLSCFWLVSRDGCNELYRQHRFEKILDWGIRSRRSRAV